MAKSISDKSSATVHQLNPKKPGAGRKTAASAKAAAQAEAMLGGKSVREVAPGVLMIEQDFLPPDPASPITAPSFGSNEPTVGVFLTHVNILVAHDVAGDELKLQLKEHRKKRKTLRLGAQEAGIVMGELDRAVKDSQTELVDLQAKLDRYLTYMDWLGHGLERQSSAPNVPKATETEQGQMRWFKRGDADGRMGKPRTVPEGCPSINVQDYLRGHEHGQGLLMQASPLTAGAFNKDGTLKTAEQVAAVPAATPAILVLQEHDFAAGTALDDANLKTLMPERWADFDAAEHVVALYGTKRRILKERDDNGGWYIDTGEPDVDITAPEEVGSSDPTAAEFA